jgi:hypothetical protein
MTVVLLAIGMRLIHCIGELHSLICDRAMQNAIPLLIKSADSRDGPVLLFLVVRPIILCVWD